MPVPATADTISPASRRWRVDHWFYVGVAGLVIGLHVAGFGPALIDESRRNDQPSWLVIVHGLVAGAWLLLFLAQATLVACRFSKPRDPFLRTFSKPFPPLE